MTREATYTNGVQWATGQYLTAARLNTEVRDNFRWILGHSDNPMPFTIVRRTSNFALTSGAFTPIQFTTQDSIHPTNATAPTMWSSTSTTYDTVEVATSALVCPLGGVVMAGGCVEIETAACNKAVRIVKNGSTVVVEADTSGVGSAAVGRINVAGAFTVNRGDFLELEAFHDLGVPLNALYQSAYSPKFWAFYVAIDT